MSTASLSAHESPEAGRGPLAAWRDAPGRWAGLAICAIWLVVLLVGLFGGDIVTSNAGGSASVPVVVVLVPFALAATIPIARRGFGPDLRSALEDERRAREALAREVAELRRPAG